MATTRAYGLHGHRRNVHESLCPEPPAAVRWPPEAGIHRCGAHQVLRRGAADGVGGGGKGPYRAPGHGLRRWPRGQGEDPLETQVSLRLWLPPLVISPSPMIPRQMRPATESISGTMQDCRRPRVSAFSWLFPPTKSFSSGSEGSGLQLPSTHLSF